MLVCHGPHNASHGQTVEIVVNENQDAQKNRRELRSHASPDVGARPAPEGRGAARLVHQADHGAQNHEEHQDSHIVAVGQHGNDAALENMGHGSLKREAGVEQRAHEDSHEQRAVNLLCDQRQSDGHDGRNQRPEGGVHGRNVLSRLLRRQRRHGEQYGQAQHRKQAGRQTFS